ncbi:hypothetical protein EHQ12_08145 [Leptospira gomenensis]|uniref:Uncharacterized protein n=1 Tax=Leptospira gomenensis TaxID=2484974 RepID=A0A5F1YEG4_9LEPT|nr:hypothetical protein [Leptospira gomenensis]TGK35968.1 hypothetical protein EHQ17_05150 [Leptospira gomenensis]TGK40001.1 hypothetical protein EHQ12_08145 [Leptospira gomenensis]TGK51450.1 hypothetical protein EHQ07_02535 [Leptospira gomenensis]TGK68007.1 hypothetical protein EHQ13_01070 [Leptospira gomenensis]
MAKKDLLKRAAGAHVRKTLGGESANESPTSSTSSESTDEVFTTLKETDSENESSIVSQEQDRISMGKTSPESSGKNDSIPDSPLKNEEFGFRKNSDSIDSNPATSTSTGNFSSFEREEEKHLPKKNHLRRISSVMRLEDYTRPETPEREGSSRLLKIAGAVLIALAIWFFWPAKHEIYMDIDKMTPEKVSGMSSQKEYHFSHGQDFFIYYKKGWSTPKKVRLTIYRTDGGKEEFSVQEKDFRKTFEKFQTYYDDTFFDQQGAYEVEIRDEDGELLVTKKFTID